MSRDTVDEEADSRERQERLDRLDRLDRLEMRFAEQERVIEDLDATVTGQWTAIEALRRQVDRLLDRLADAERRLPAETDAPPPHY